MFFPFEVLFEHVSEDFIGGGRELGGILLVAFSEVVLVVFVAFHDVVADVGSFGERVDVLFLLYGVDLFVFLEGFLFGDYEFVTVWGNVLGRNAVAETF